MCYSAVSECYWSNGIFDRLLYMVYNMQNLQALLLSVRNVVTVRVFIKLRTFFGSLETRFLLKMKVSFV